MRHTICFVVVSALLLTLPAPAAAQGVVGCSVVPASWGAVQQGLDRLFFGACTRHDRCYRICNPVGGPYVGYGYKSSCDAALYTELLLACETWSLILSFPNVEWVDQQAFLNECATYASYGYAAVSTYGLVVFLDGQCTYRCNAWACTQSGRVYGPAEMDFCDLFCGGGLGRDRDDCDLFPFGPNCPICPVGIDLQGNGLKLTGPTPPVHFDLDADGNPDRTSWTRMQTKDGWLVLDRNGNGVIDDGRELFGNATPLLLSGELAAQGFEALAEFDGASLGGNEDGVIDAGDAIFNRLQVWLDTNRDGMSQEGELLSLSDLSIASISLACYRSDTEDQWGNTFRWWSAVQFEDGSESTAVDVFFSRVPDE